MDFAPLPIGNVKTYTVTLRVCRLPNDIKLSIKIGHIAEPVRVVFRKSDRF